jgi:hypothetical protein
MTSVTRETNRNENLAASAEAISASVFFSSLWDCHDKFELFSNPINNTDPAFKLFLYSHLITSSLFGCDGEEPDNYAIDSAGDSPAFFFMNYKPAGSGVRRRGYKV